MKQGKAPRSRWWMELGRFWKPACRGEKSQHMATQTKQINRSPVANSGTHDPTNQRITGWWFQCFSSFEKYESQLGCLFPMYGKIKVMFQTTNQMKTSNTDVGQNFQNSKPQISISSDLDSSPIGSPKNPDFHIFALSRQGFPVVLQIGE